MLVCDVLQTLNYTVLEIQDIMKNVYNFDEEIRQLFLDNFRKSKSLNYLNLLIINDSINHSK